MMTQIWKAPGGAVEDAITEMGLSQAYLVSLQRLLVVRKTTLTKQEQDLLNGALDELGSARDRLKTLTVNQ
jgi:hypothetical protein